MALLQPFNQIAFTDGTNPIVGAVGEYIESYIVQASAVALTSGTVINILTLNLLPGDWEIRAAINFGVGVLTLSNNIIMGISQTSLTFNLDPRSGYLTDQNRLSMVLPKVRQKIAAGTDPTVTTPVYLVLKTTFGLTALSAWGFIAARRVV